jgi:hypothetical protein
MRNFGFKLDIRFLRQYLGREEEILGYFVKNFRVLLLTWLLICGVTGSVQFNSSTDSSSGGDVPGTPYPFL